MTESELEQFNHLRLLRAERDRHTDMAAACSEKLKTLLSVIDMLTKKIDNHPAKRIETAEINTDIDELGRF